MTTLQSTSERLEDALRRLAVEAADLLEAILASGAELPFDLEASESETSPLPMFSYSPLTGQFIREHSAELGRLEAFQEVRELASGELAIGFLIGLWEGRSEFDIAGDRLEGAIDGALAHLGADAPGATDAGDVIVPVLGFHMPADEVVLDGVRIVRADSMPDAPREALDGRNRFVARISCGSANVAPAAAVADDLHRALRTLRLFRPGAVGIAPHGWVRRPDGWERFGTGAGRPRNGGYRLTGNEVSELERFSATLTKRGARMPALAWAISRFDLGSERASVIEALSDYLLALRGLLEGGGPAGAGLTARVAALACEGADERERARVCVERALTIERTLMSGARYRPAADASPLAVIAELEELLRRILNRLATGEIGGDLRSAADEVLLSEGLASASAAAEATIGATAEWSLPDLDGEEPEFDLTGAADASVAPEDEIEIHRATAEPDPDAAGEPTTIAFAGGESHDSARERPTARIVIDDVELPEIMGTGHENGAPEGGREPEQQAPKPFATAPEPELEPEADWFASADGELEWPAFASPRRGRDERSRELSDEANDRVRYLFPVPDATDWDVGELRYEDRKSS